MGTVRIAGLTKSYGGTVNVLDGIDLDIGDGEFFTLLGPSGCGKTTLLRSIAGFMPQDGGTISFDGQPIDALPAHRRDIGMVFQDYAIFPHLSVRDNVAFGLRARRLPRGVIAERVAEAIRTVRLDGFEGRGPASLSGGQQQRVGIARALAIRPRLLLMDEPLSNLDAKLRVEMREDIRDIQRRLGITTIYVTHDQEEALAISDRVCVLNGGRIEQVGSPFEIYHRPARRFAAGFVGSMNFLPAAVADGALLFAGRSWALDRPESPGPVEIAIRPENVLLGASAVARPGIALTGTLTKTVFLGREAQCSVGTEAGTVSVQLADFPPALLDSTGQAMELTLPLDRLTLFRPDGGALAAGFSR